MKVYTGRELARIVARTQKRTFLGFERMEWGAILAGVALALVVVYSLSFFSHVCLKAECAQNDTASVYGTD